MKKIAFIMAMLIFFASVKADAGVRMLLNTFELGLFQSSCCASKTDQSETKLCSDSEDQSKKGCCEGQDCNCTCCMHIAFHNPLILDYQENKEIPSSIFGYRFDYSKDYLHTIFHPPAFFN